MGDTTPLQWHPISSILPFAEAVILASASTRTQVGHLDLARHQPGLIDQGELVRMRCIYEESTRLIRHSGEQLRYWRRQHPTSSDLLMLDHLDTLVEQWRQNTQHIIDTITAMVADRPDQ